MEKYIKINTQEVDIIKDLLSERIEQLKRHLYFNGKHQFLPEEHQTQLNDIIKRQLSEYEKLNNKL